MRENYRGNKKRREEAHRKKQEEKRNKRLNKSKTPALTPEAEINPVIEPPTFP